MWIIQITHINGKRLDKPKYVVDNMGLGKMTDNINEAVHFISDVAAIRFSNESVRLWKITHHKTYDTRIMQHELEEASPKF